MSIYIYIYWLGLVIFCIYYYGCLSVKLVGAIVCYSLLSHDICVFCVYDVWRLSLAVPPSDTAKAYICIYIYQSTEIRTISPYLRIYQHISPLLSL